MQLPQLLTFSTAMRLDCLKATRDWQIRSANLLGLLIIYDDHATVLYFNTVYFKHQAIDIHYTVTCKQEILRRAGYT